MCYLYRRARDVCLVPVCGAFEFLRRLSHPTRLFLSRLQLSLILSIYIFQSILACRVTPNRSLHATDVALAEGGSSSGTFPTADSLTNTNITCRDGVPWAGTQSQDDPSSSLSSSEAPPCSNGSACLEGDLGVYCPCYIQRSSLRQACNTPRAGSDILPYLGSVNVVPTMSINSACMPDVVISVAAEPSIFHTCSQCFSVSGLFSFVGL